MTTAAATAEKIVTECHRCQGTGKLGHLKHIAHGVCFLCGGVGSRKVEIKPSATATSGLPCKALSAEQCAAIEAHIDLTATAKWAPSMEIRTLAHVTRIDYGRYDLIVDIEADGEHLIGGLVRFCGRRGIWQIEAISDGLRRALPPFKAKKLIAAIER